MGNNIKHSSPSEDINNEANINYAKDDSNILDALKDKRHNEISTNFTSCHSKSKTLAAIYKTQSGSLSHTNNGLFLLLQKNKKISAIEKEELNIRINVRHVIPEGKGILSKKYQIMTKLAHGATGTVFIGKNMITNETVAVKLVEKNNKNIDLVQMKTEVILLKNINHPNILRLFEFYESPTAFYMISELCKYGELYDRIKRGFSERELSIILYQIFQALDYCHDNNIVHRDLKLENILVNNIEKVYDDISKKEIELFWVKLIDFGTAKMFVRNRNERAIIGTSYYIAPEVLKKNYNEKCDTWSVGVILYILVTGKPPFDGKNDNEIMHKIKNGIVDYHNQKFMNSTIECQDLIKKLLEIKIDKRLSAKSALKHIWFVKNKTVDILSRLSPEKAHVYIDNLFSYSVQSKLYQLIMSFMVHNSFQLSEMNDILKLLRQFDSTSELRINYSDFVKGISHYKPLELYKERIDELFLSLDRNNDGYIEYEELLCGMLSKDEFKTEGMIRYAFKFFDMNNMNSLTVNSIVNTFSSIGINISEKLCKKFFDEMKIDDDEREIFYDMFKHYLTKRDLFVL